MVLWTFRVMLLLPWLIFSSVFVKKTFTSQLYLYSGLCIKMRGMCWNVATDVANIPEGLMNVMGTEIYKKSSMWERPKYVCLPTVFPRPEQKDLQRRMEELLHHFHPFSHVWLYFYPNLALRTNFRYSCFFFSVFYFWECCSHERENILLFVFGLFCTS